MGLYYRAILSSLLLNFLPDLPRTFFTPQYPILFFFHFGFYFFSFFLPHYRRFTTSKKKKNRLICLCRGNVLFFFFPHKSPHFLWGLSSRTDRSLPQFQRRWPQHWRHNDTKSGNPLFLLRELWQLFPTHYMAHGMPTLHRHPHWTSAKITTNTLIHPFIFHPSARHLICLPRVCCLWHAGQSAVRLFDP